MSETSSCVTYCPFTRRLCTECGIYRGRHRHIVFNRSGEADGNGTNGDAIASYFRGMEKMANPWNDIKIKSKEELKIRLMLIDAESGKSRPCDLEEAKRWDWGDPETMRIINDRQVRSFKHLTEMLSYNESKGHAEVTMYEFPRFMFLCGG